ncbi:anthranilate synthase [candidate division WOR-1 bacterium DG_54_3]|uniref:Anthranilate synthase component 1 n=1 Tax=candidate division WOR-1 bacterium DG_54_3 TaxID=1703775 RepID=A0A0S7XTE3_UNCSA|nr:MAG: anthranilate synthase [candidate division WOR-1 bacterium DG_54_3]
MYYPDKQEFVKLSKKGNLIPVYKEIVADMETPVSAYKKIEGDYSFLLESVEGGEKIARYSFLGTCSRQAVLSPKSFFEIKPVLAKFKPVPIPGLPRFHGGLVGYLGYDVVREFESVSDKNPDDLELPKMIFLVTDTILAFDHIKHKILIISNASIKNNPEAAYEEAVRKIEALDKKLRKPIKLEELETKAAPKTELEIKSNMSKEQFEKMVLAAKEYVKAGDIIQVVLSQRFETPFKKDPFDVYRVLRIINPSPYMFYLKFGGLKLVGSSPEVMVRLEGREAVIRPIAGTRPRGKSEAEDEELQRELLASEKERAEHLMLVDLARNDLGRVCEYGSIETSELMAIEKYSHVMHIVSNVRGRMKKDKDAFNLIQASFPAGTVSGAPKIRAMEIIDELENVKRGPYAGAVGYFDFMGNLDTGIIIRTILMSEGRAYVQAGAGIVADSIPEQEYNETVNKAKGMLRAIELAQ